MSPPHSDQNMTKRGPIFASLLISNLDQAGIDNIRRLVDKIANKRANCGRASLAAAHQAVHASDVLLASVPLVVLFVCEDNHEASEDLDEIYEQVHTVPAKITLE